MPTTLRYIPNVVTLKLDAETCNGCGMCAEVCPHAVFKIENRKAALADRDACMECGACARNCPTGAIEVVAGVGCAAAIINSKLKGTAPSCGCGGDAKSSGCC